MPDAPKLPESTLKLPSLESLLPGWRQLVSHATTLGAHIAAVFFRRPITCSLVNTCAIVGGFKLYRLRRERRQLAARSYTPNGSLSDEQARAARTSTRFDCTGQVVVVTGGTTGIGRACCEAFLAAGAAAVYNLDVLPSTDAGVGEFVRCDVAKPAEVERCIARVVETHGGRLDCVVSNAGVWAVHPELEMLTEKEFDRVIGINIKGAMFTIKAALPAMRRAGHGNIVIIGSDQSFVGKPKQNLYGLTKAALAQLAKSLAAQYAPEGIRVNCVCPGTIDTPLMHGAVAKIVELEGGEAQPRYDWLKTAQPVPRLGTPEEIAQAVLMCTSIGFMAGALVPVDGGYTAV